MNSLTIVQQPTGHPFNRMIVGERASKDRDSRLQRFVDFQRRTGQRWHAPDLAAYRDHLQGGEVEYAASTVASYLATVKGAYRDLLTDNGVRQILFDSMPDGLSFADRKAMVDEKLARIENAINSKAARVKVTTKQDEADSAHVRLTYAQAVDLLGQPGFDTLQGIRDTAALAVLLCTGIRAAELCALDVDDLRQEYGGLLSVHVRQGKGNKARLVPYGDLDWCLIIVDRWLAWAGIVEGPVFRGLYRPDSDGNQQLRPGRLSKRAVGYTLKRYPINIDGELRAVKPHDCRRTYAKQRYLEGMGLLSIRDNLGHTDVKITQGYIGPTDPSERAPAGGLRFDLSGLDSIPRQRRLEGLADGS